MDELKEIMNQLTGACHCGNISFQVELSHETSSYQPRACDCDFCQKHAANYISDKDGSLSIQIGNQSDLRIYQQGSKLADFLLCKKCGVLVAVVYQEAEQLYGAINGQSLNHKTCLGDPIVTSPKQLSSQEKIARWKNIWFSNVKIEYGIDNN